jgi:hypothetical protein
MKKKLVLLAILAGGMSFTTGCQTPGYTGQERFQRIGRNWGFEYEQINDDVDEIFLLRPADHLTEWNIR